MSQVSESPFLQTDNDPLSDDQHAALDKPIFALWEGADNPSRLVVLVAIPHIVSADKRLLRRYRDIFEVEKLLQEHGDLEEFVKRAWRSGSLKQIRNLGTSFRRPVKVFDAETHDSQRSCTTPSISMHYSRNLVSPLFLALISTTILCVNKTRESTLN